MCNILFIFYFFQLKTIFPKSNFKLPSKKWFGNNLDPIFLEQRQLGLQLFLNNILSLKYILKR